MSRTAKMIAIALACVILLALVFSCGNRQTVAYAPAPVVAQPTYVDQQPAVVAAPPVVVQQPVVVGSHDGFFTGMMMGHMMGSMGSTHTTTVVHAAPAPVYRPAPAPVYRPGPVYRPSYTTNSRGVSTSISRSGSISVRSGRRR